MIGPSRRCASRLLSRCHRCSAVAERAATDFASTPPPIVALPLPCLELPPTSRRGFASSSSSFRNDPIQSRHPDGHEAHKNREEGGGVRSSRVSSRESRDRGPRQSNQRHNQRPGYHSVRLVSEAAARTTTQKIIDAYDSFDESRLDATSVLAAEHALEFWANRNNHSRQKKRGHQTGKGDDQIALEGDADTALRLFEALHHFHRQDGRVLSNGMYAHVIDALAKSPNVDHVHKADALLRQFIALYLKRGAMGGRQMMDGLALLRAVEDEKVTTCPSIPDSIDWNEDRHHFPNSIRITGVMRGYARQLHPGGAESLLSLMMALSSSGGSTRIFRPNEIGFATVIDAYSRVGDGSNAERILQLMKSRSLDANVIAYNSAISAWARAAKQSSDGDGAISASRGAAEKAERLLREMWRETGTEGSARDVRDKPSTRTVVPDVVTYSSVITAYASCADQPFGINRARELLTELEGVAVQEVNETRQNSTRTRNTSGRHPHGFQPNNMVYNSVLQSYANAGDASAAEKILQSMISLHSSSLNGGGGGPYQHVRPNTRTFNIVLNAWAKSGDGVGGVQANEMLDRMEDMASGGDKTTRPDVISYNTALAAWSHCASIVPSSLSSAAVVGKSAAYEALKLLDKIEHICITQSNGGKFDRRRPPFVKPDAISYNTTIAAFANAAQTCKDGISMAEEAEAILARMKERLGVEPDDYSYNGVILAWARSSGGLPAAKRAESILRAMKNPTAMSWSSVITAYAHADAAQKAESLLREMEQKAMGSSGHEKSGRPQPVPSIVLYNNVLHAWGKSSDRDAARNAEDLLTRLEKTPKLPKPDIISYRLVLTALEHTKDPDKATRGKSVLNRLLASVQDRIDGSSTREIQNAFNSVLTACAYTSANAGKDHRDESAEIIMQTLRDMNQFPWPADVGGVNGPNQETYALFMQGCTHLFDRPEERSMLLKSTFRECCQKGLLNNIIWDKFCTALGPPLAEVFVNETWPEVEARPRDEEDCKSLKYDELPLYWSRSSNGASSSS